MYDHLNPYHTPPDSNTCKLKIRVRPCVSACVCRIWARISQKICKPRKCLFNMLWYRKLCSKAGVSCPNDWQVTVQASLFLHLVVPMNTNCGTPLLIALLSLVYRCHYYLLVLLLVALFPFVGFIVGVFNHRRRLSLQITTHVAASGSCRIALYSWVTAMELTDNPEFQQRGFRYTLPINVVTGVKVNMAVACIRP